MAQFRIEHVAPKPSGWRVRTKRTGRHELRIAFPPGPQRTGSGKLLEVLHPKGERNPDCELAGKNPAELIIFGNPSAPLRVGYTVEGDRFEWLDAGKKWLVLGTNADGREIFRQEYPKLVVSVKRKLDSMFDRMTPQPSDKNPGTLYDAIRPRDRVTIVDRFGQRRTGRAVMLGPAGWVLNMGGAHGTPAIASPENVTQVKKSNSSANPAWMKIDGVIGKVIDSRGTVGSPEYLLETKDGRQVWVKPHHRPRANPPWTLAERKRFEKYERQREEIINRLHAQKSYPPPTDAAEEEHFRYLLSATQRRMDRLAKKLMRNPDVDEEKKAVQLFQTFHGKDPRGIIEKHVSDAMRMEYTALGALEYLIVENDAGDKVQINFQGDGVTLASSPQANQLYFIGGNQNLAPCLGKFTDDKTKDFIDLGDALEVQYLARKAQGNFEPVKYFHQFGKEKRGSDLPRAIYDKLRKQVFLAGGEYTIEQPGIIN